MKNRRVDGGFVSFEHETDYENSRVVVVYAREDGMVVLAFFSFDEFEMVKSVVELTNEDPYGVISDLVNDGNVVSVVFDPKDFG